MRAEGGSGRALKKEKERRGGPWPGRERRESKVGTLFLFTRFSCPSPRTTRHMDGPAYNSMVRGPTVNPHNSDGPPEWGVRGTPPPVRARPPRPTRSSAPAMFFLGHSAKRARALTSPTILTLLLQGPAPAFLGHRKRADEAGPALHAYAASVPAPGAAHAHHHAAAPPQPLAWDARTMDHMRGQALEAARTLHTQVIKRERGGVRTARKARASAAVFHPCGASRIGDRPRGLSMRPAALLNAVACNSMSPRLGLWSWKREKRPLNPHVGV